MTPSAAPQRILVICTGNRVRSQMAEGWLRAARDDCPVFSNAGRVLYREFEDPDYPEMSRDQLRDVFRNIRDEIAVWSREFLSSSGHARAGEKARRQGGDLKG